MGGTARNFDKGASAPMNQGNLARSTESPGRHFLKTEMQVHGERCLRFPGPRLRAGDGALRTECQHRTRCPNPAAPQQPRQGQLQSTCLSRPRSFPRHIRVCRPGPTLPARWRVGAARAPPPASSRSGTPALPRGKTASWPGCSAPLLCTWARRRMGAVASSEALLRPGGARELWGPKEGLPRLPKLPGLSITVLHGV